MQQHNKSIPNQAGTQVPGACRDLTERISIGDQGKVQALSKDWELPVVNDETCFRSTKQAAYGSDAIMKQPPKRGNLNSEKSMAIPCQYKDEVSWVVRRDDTEATYIS